MGYDARFRLRQRLQKHIVDFFGLSLGYQIFLAFKLVQVEVRLGLHLWGDGLGSCLGGGVAAPDICAGNAWQHGVQLELGLSYGLHHFDG